MAITDLHDICCSSSDTNTIGQRGTTLNLQILGQCEHINFFWAIIMFILLTWHFFNNYWGFRFRPWCCAINYLTPIIIFLGKISQFFGLGKRKVSTMVLQQVGMGKWVGPSRVRSACINPHWQRTGSVRPASCTDQINWSAPTPRTSQVKRAGPRA